jgi:hypothetical protein
LRKLITAFPIINYIVIVEVKMAVKEIMDTLANQTVANKKLSELVKDIRLVGNVLEVIFMLPDRTLESEIREKAMQALKGVEGIGEVRVRFADMTPPPQQSPAFQRRRLSGIKHLIVVGSGRVVWANPPWRSIWRLPFPNLATRWGFWTRTSTDPACPPCLA